MKKHWIAIFISMTYAFSTYGQVTFQKIFNRSSFLSATVPTTDGGYATVCSPMIDFTNTYKMSLIKTNSNGDTLWTKKYGAPSFVNTGNFVIQTQDSGYLLCSDVLLKVNSSGVAQWSKKLLNNLYFNVTQAVESANGDFTMVGKSMQTTGMDISFARFTNTGNTVFAKSFGSLDQDEVFFIEPTHTGGFIIGGQTYQQGGVNAKGFLVKTDGSGNILWSKTYDTPSGDIFYSGRALADGGFGVTGIIATNSLSYAKMLLFKVDSAGTLQWAKTYQDTVTYGFDLLETPDNRLLLAGRTNKGSYGRALLLNVDSTGTVIWRKEYAPTTNNLYSLRFNTIRSTTDGGYILSGLGDFSNISGSYLVKTDSNGDNFNNCYQSTFPPMTAMTIVPTVANFVVTTASDFAATYSTIDTCYCDTILTICTSVGMETHNSKPLVSVHPNPFNNQLKIECTNTDMFEVILFNVTTQIMLNQKFVSNITLNTESLQKGFYIYQIKNKSGIISTGKLVKN